MGCRGTEISYCVPEHTSWKLFYSFFWRLTVFSKLQCSLGVCLLFFAFFMTFSFLNNCKMVRALELQQRVSCLATGGSKVGKIIITGGIYFARNLLYFSKRIYCI